VLESSNISTEAISAGNAFSIAGNYFTGFASFLLLLRL